MLELASQIPLCIILAGLLGLLIGYFLAKESCETLEVKEDTHH